MFFYVLCSRFYARDHFIRWNWNWTLFSLSSGCHRWWISRDIWDLLLLTVWNRRELPTFYDSDKWKTSLGNLNRLTYSTFLFSSHSRSKISRILSDDNTALLTCVYASRKSHSRHIAAAVECEKRSLEEREVKSGQKGKQKNNPYCM